MKYTLQVHTGSWHETLDSPENIARKIGEAASRIPADSVIIGWNTDPAYYREAAAVLRGSGIRMLLWLPAFSEANRIAGTDGAEDIFGKPAGMPDERSGESFVFDCPSSRHNIRAVEGLYEKFFSDCGFDGVFLDRIRTQSFAAGVSGVLSCGCGRCRKAFLERGVDLQAVRERYELKRDAFFDMASWPADGRFEPEDELARRFFEAKEEIIAAAAADICGYFKDRGLTVGLDLFAPAVSRLVGQHYAKITERADFIKPMLYRRTEAPAGIGYEYALFEKHAPAARGRGKPAPDRAFLDAQLDAAKAALCDVYPGIEINYDRDTVRTDAGYITESLAAVRDRGFERAVLCWDVATAPEAHIEAVSRFEKDADQKEGIG